MRLDFARTSGVQLAAAMGLSFITVEVSKLKGKGKYEHALLRANAHPERVKTLNLDVFTELVPLCMAGQKLGAVRAPPRLARVLCCPFANAGVWCLHRSPRP